MLLIGGLAQKTMCREHQKDTHNNMHIAENILYTFPQICAGKKHTPLA